ncbi:FtsX-like permease family protein [Treponema sp. HNW]|uniref:ABC transporter permease n=1 Tax=Treponema sp. HNW TaxID=3116654 RepID=UPI003D0C6C4B
MNFRASFLYALRILKPNRTSSSNGRKSLFGAAFGIALSLVPLIVVLVVAEGMIEGITERMIGLGTYHLQAVVPVEFFENGGLSDDLREFASSLEIPSGGQAFIERQGTALAVAGGTRSGALVRAVPTDIFTSNRAFQTYIEVLSGEAAFPSAKSAVIGKGIADKLNLKTGDTLRLITAGTGVYPSAQERVQGHEAGRVKIVPKMLSCTVSGIVSSGYQEIDALWVFLPLKTGFDFLTEASSQITIGIETDFPFSDRLQEAYRSTLSLLPSGFSLYRWSDINSAQYENYASTKILLILIMFLIVLIASVNVSSALIMVVMERKREIAVLKSMGASSSGIGAAFLTVGILTGACGLAIGLPLGLAAAVKCNEIIGFGENAVNFILKLWYLIREGNLYSPVHLLDPAYYLQRVPVHIAFTEIFVIAAGTLLLSAAVSVFPALRAGKERPLDILRKT